jgi:hypothetical protein
MRSCIGKIGTTEVSAGEVGGAEVGIEAVWRDIRI